MSVELMGSKARVGSKFYKRIENGDRKVKVLFEKLAPICELEAFILEAERLSRIAGINAATVAKKIPAKDKDSLVSITKEAWKKSQELCLEANKAFGIGPVDPFENPAALLGNVRPPENFKEEIWGLRYMFQLLMEPYKRTRGRFLGPGVAIKERGTSSGLTERGPSTSSSRFSKLDNWGVWSNPYFNPLSFDDDQVRELSLDLWQCRFEPARYSQVAKDKSKNRSIVVGVPAQISAQRMVDKGIRRTLKMKGIDLTTLANFNRLKAFEGSLNGNIDTLDLSSASDHISIGLFAYLCKGNPSTEALFKDVMYTRNAIIATDYTDNAQLYTYSQGVDGMGNPAIFSLESAIFTAINAWVILFGPAYSPDGLYIPRATQGGNLLWRGKTVKWKWFASFGDDQAPPSMVPIELWHKIYQKLYMVLNPDKSFGLDEYGQDCMFRESCGADFQNGVFKRGFYLKTLEPTLYDAVRLYNFFSLYYGLGEDVFKSSKLYKKVKRQTVGAWIDDCWFITSDLIFENRVPDNFLIVKGIQGTPRKTLVWHTGNYASWSTFYTKCKSAEHSSVDLALLACNSGSTGYWGISLPCNEYIAKATALYARDVLGDSTVFWYDTTRFRYFALQDTSEEDWNAFLSSASRDLAFGRRTTNADLQDVIDMEDTFIG